MTSRTVPGPHAAPMKSPQSASLCQGVRSLDQGGIASEQQIGDLGCPFLTAVLMLLSTAQCTSIPSRDASSAQCTLGKARALSVHSGSQHDHDACDSRVRNVPNIHKADHHDDASRRIPLSIAEFVEPRSTTQTAADMAADRKRDSITRSLPPASVLGMGLGKTFQRNFWHSPLCGSVRLCAGEGACCRHCESLSWEAQLHPTCYYPPHTLQTLSFRQAGFQLLDITIGG